LIKSEDPALDATGTFRTIRPRVRRQRSPLSRWYRRNERAVLSMVGVASFALIWQLASELELIRSTFFSSPVAVLQAGVREVQLPRFWTDVQASVTVLVIGFAASLVTAVPLGIAIGWFRRMSYSFDPWLNFFNALPRVALLPLVVLWAGLGLEMKAVMVFLGGFFSIILPVVDGVRTVEKSFLDVSRSFGASQRRLFVSVLMPSTVPFIMTGLRLGVGRVLVGVIIAELYAQTTGLGVMIARAGANLQIDRMLFAVLIFTVGGILLTELVGSVERHFQRWRPNPDTVEGT
jgi:ABC-type nitrate/sulfonate/bicarbonate transport system permease component